MGYLIPSGVAALIALDNQTQNIANFTGGTGISYFYIEYVIEQVPVAAVSGIDQLRYSTHPEWVDKKLYCLMIMLNIQMLHGQLSV